MTIRQQIYDVIYQIKTIEYIDDDKRVIELKKIVMKERKEKLDALEKKLKQLKKERDVKESKPKLRWPENTPQKIIDFCQKYWNGTTERMTFRIHAWNNKGVITSYPGKVDWAGVCQRAYHQPEYYLVRFDTERSHDHVKSWHERMSKEQMNKTLAELK